MGIRRKKQRFGRREAESRTQRKRKSKRVKVQQVIETKTNIFFKRAETVPSFSLKFLINLCRGLVFSNLRVSPVLPYTYAPVVLPQWGGG